MPLIDPNHPLAELLERDQRYPLDAYLFVLEALSVMLQVSFFKYHKRKTGVGKRIFLRAPLHHHFEQLGWHENQVVMRFYILAGLFASLALLTLKIR